MFSSPKGKMRSLSRDLRIHHTDVGNGRPLVFVPGWTFGFGVFKKQLAALSPDFRVVSYDPRGQGASSKTEAGHNYRQHACDLNLLIRKLNLKRPVLIGWSSGTATLFEYFQLFGGDEVEAFVLVDGAPKYMGDGVEWAENTLAGWRAAVHSFREDRGSFTKGFCEYIAGEPLPTSELNYLTKMSLQTPSAIAMALTADCMLNDYTDTAIEIGRNHSSLWITRDEWGPLAKQWFAENAPSAEHTSFGGHLNFWTHEEQFNRILSDYVGV